MVKDIRVWASAEKSSFRSLLMSIYPLSMFWNKITKIGIHTPTHVVKFHVSVSKKSILDLKIMIFLAEFL